MKSAGEAQGDERVRANLAAAMGYGGWPATILSELALVISAYSLYEPTFKTADIEVYIPLTLITAAPRQPDLIDRVLGDEPAPVVFERMLPWLSDQQLDDRQVAISAANESRSEAAAGVGGRPAAR